MTAAHHRRIAGLVALCAVTSVCALPSFQTYPPAADLGFLWTTWLMRTSIFLIPTTFLTAMGWRAYGVGMRSGIGWLPFQVPILVSIIAGLPWISTMPNILPSRFSDAWLVWGSLGCASIVSCSLSNLSAFFRLRNAPGDHDTSVACVYWALVIASLINALSPFPLFA